MRWVWFTLAWQDIKYRYRGSFLGPFWSTASTAVIVVGMGLIFSRTFKTHSGAYVPYLAVGLVFWQFIALVVGEGCQTFVSPGAMIQQVAFPLSIHAYRVVARNILVFGHNALVILVVLVLYRGSVSLRVVELALALTLFAVNGVWVSILLGMLTARFRDVTPIVTNLLQILFLMTPIFWPTTVIGDWQRYVELSPIFAAIDVVRAPLIGIPTSPYSWPIFLAMTAAGCAAGFVLFAHFRSRIPYWI